LTRDQYKPPNPFLVRKAPWGVQLGKHFWDYSRNQYSLGLRPEWLGWYLPYVLGLVGAVFQARRDRKGFAFLGASYLIMTLGLVFYLNFATDEVRPRDYFFAGAYQFFGVWIGLGAGALIMLLRQGEKTAAAGARLTVGAGIVAVLLPVMTARHFWYEHDRHHFEVARDFARNMLVPLKPNAILFTNGDNDTFPLWYLQEVEHVRKDVRVACLSLLNTHWYIKQLRDFAPKVDFGWSDEEIDNLESYIDGRTQEPVWINDMAVARAVQREYGKRPIYVAVTVPDLKGMEDRLVMQGLVFELLDPLPGATDRVDADLTLHNLREVYHYGGILKANGTFDRSVYKDLSTTHLIQNYAAAYLRAAEEKLAKGDEAAAMDAAAAAREISPDARPIRYAVGVLLMRGRRFAEAESFFQDVLGQGGADSRLYLLLARSEEAQGKLSQAEENYRKALETDRSDFEALRDLFSFLWESRGRRADALEVLRGWVRDHPEDQRVAAALEQYADSLRIGGGPR
jgi:tetratricopeptide (TPR) repeat protein